MNFLYSLDSLAIRMSGYDILQEMSVNLHRTHNASIVIVPITLTSGASAVATVTADGVQCHQNIDRVDATRADMLVAVNIYRGGTHTVARRGDM